MSTPATLPARQWWQQRNAREKSLLRAVALLLALALLWALALAPAVRTLRSFDGQYARQEAQLQTMLRLQAQAQRLQAQPTLAPASAAQALQASVQQAFGAQASVSLQANSATVNVREVSAQALAQWLASARTQAHAAPQQARLTHSAQGWSGTLQMDLPAPP